MKKVDFLDLVCAELVRVGVEDAEIRIQRQNIDRYLTSMGVGEDSPALDGENPAAFAKLICGNIAKKQSAAAHAATPEPQTAPAAAEMNDFAEEMPNVETVEEIAPAASAVQPVYDEIASSDAVAEDVKIFNGSHADDEPVFEAPLSVSAETEPSFEDARGQTAPEAPIFEEDVSDVFDVGYAETAYSPPDTYEGNPVDEQRAFSNEHAEYSPEDNVSEETPYYEEADTEYVSASEHSNGTIEFNVPKVKKKNAVSNEGELEAEEDYFEKNDDEDYVPSGNPALFWVLVVLTSFLWIPLLVAFAAGVGLGFVFMLIFEALYVPSIVAIIIGGSAVSFAELIYSIIRFAGKNPAVAFFELGLGLLVAALTVGLPTVMYYLGVSVFPGWIKNYGRNVKRLMRKLRRVYRKLKGACSI